MPGRPERLLGSGASARVGIGMKEIVARAEGLEGYGDGQGNVLSGLAEDILGGSGFVLQK